MGTVVCLHSSWFAIMFKLFCLLGAASLAFAGHPVCKTVWEEKCWNEPREQCNTVQKPYTVTDYKEECSTISVPNVVSVPKEVCVDVPEETCTTTSEQKCSTKYEVECYTKYEDECRQVSSVNRSRMRCANRLRAQRSTTSTRLSVWWSPRRSVRLYPSLFPRHWRRKCVLPSTPRSAASSTSSCAPLSLRNGVLPSLRRSAPL